MIRHPEMEALAAAAGKGCYAIFVTHGVERFCIRYFPALHPNPAHNPAHMLAFRYESWWSDKSLTENGHTFETVNHALAYTADLMAVIPIDVVAEYLGMTLHSGPSLDQANHMWNLIEQHLRPKEVIAEAFALPGTVEVVSLGAP